MNIVPFEPKHTDGVVALILPIQQIEFNVPITLAMQPDLLEIPSFYQKGIGNFWVAIDENEVVGTIALIDIGNAQVCLRKMFLKATHRGSATGLGQALLDIAIVWCEAHAVTDIFLGTREDLTAARRFYERNGFTLLPKANLPESFPVMSVDSHFYQYSFGR